MDYIYSAIIFSAPCWVANSILALLYPLKKIWPEFKAYDKPIDFGFNFLGTRLFGDSRTVLGLAVMINLAIIWYAVSLDIEDLYKIIITYFGTLLGSFIKRRFKAEDGDSFPIVDQADYMFLILPIWLFFSDLTLTVAIISLAITIIGQPIVCYISHRIKLKARPY